jgi:hypothetical protein
MDTKRSFLDGTPIGASNLVIESTCAGSTSILVTDTIEASETSFATVFKASALSTPSLFCETLNVTSLSYADLVLGQDLTSDTIALSRLSLLQSFGGPPNRLVTSIFETDQINNALSTSLTTLNVVDATVSQWTSLSALNVSGTLRSTITYGTDLTVTNLSMSIGSEVSLSTLSANSAGTILTTTGVASLTSLSDLSTLSGVFNTTVNFLQTLTSTIDATSNLSTFTVLVDGTYELSGTMGLAMTNAAGTTGFNNLGYTVSDLIALNLYTNNNLTRQLIYMNNPNAQYSVTVMMYPYSYIGTFSQGDNCVLQGYYNRVVAAGQTRLCSVRERGSTISSNVFYRLGPK